MVFRITELLLALGLLITGAWAWSGRTYEPIAAFVAALIAVVAMESKRRSVINLGATKVRTWFARRARLRGVELRFKFDLAHLGRAEHHEIEVVRHFAGSESLYRVSLRHILPDSTSYWVCELEGHGVNLDLLDIDSDNIPELIVRWHTGAHTHVVRVFRLLSGAFREIPGSEIGSDWPEILLEDRDKDGILEIYAKHRNWQGEPTSEWIEEAHELQDGEFRRSQLGA